MLDLVKDGLTQGMLNNFCACEKRFYLTANRWAKKQTGIGLLFGSLVHEQLDWIYSAKKINLKELTKRIDSYFTSENSMGAQEQDLELMRAKASVLLPEYIKFYAKDFTEKKFVDVEKVFSVPYIGVILKGKKDGVYQAKDKTFWLMEHKCYSRIDEDNFLLTLALNFQNLFYVLAEELERQKRVSGVLYNIIRNPQQKFLKDDNVKTYCDRLLKEVQKNPEHFFIRYEIPYTRKDKEAFRNDLKIWIGKLSALINCATPDREEMYLRNLSSCEGRYNCQYLEACVTGKLNSYIQRDKIYPELED